MKKALLMIVCMLAVMLVYGCAGEESDVSSVAESKPSDSLPSVSLLSAPSAEESSQDNGGIVLPPEETAAESFSSLPSEETSSEANDVTDAPEVSEPLENDPSQEPQESEPEESSQEPDESEPDESQPEESEPAESQPEESEDEPVYDIGDAEWTDTGYLLYNGAAYSQAHYHADVAQQYADIYARYAELYPEIGIHAINHPASVYNITNPAVAAMVVNQAEVLDNMQSHIYGDVNFVNLKIIFKEHAGEYLYFKSDYHWTQLGAYYAYCAFAESVGLTPTSLSAFEERVITDSFIGHTNDYANDDRILSFVDTVYAYMPTKEHTMAVYLRDMSLYRVYNNCIQPSIKNYSCFLTGDQAFSVINVPENDQNKVALVIKESSANAFVPFLTEHYGNIVVIDPRHIVPNVKEVIAEYGVTDIIFFATASTCSRDAYCKYYERLLGE